jgi:regulatory protein
VPPGKKPRLLDAQGLRDYAARALSARALTAGELRTKLRRKAADAADVEPLIERLRELGAINDARFASAFTERRIENDHFGKMRVLRDLRQRKVASGVAEKAVAKAFAEVDETELIEQYIARKFRGKDLPVFLAEEKNLATAFRRLRTAGFSAGNALRVLRRYSVRAEEIEETAGEDG